MDEYKIGNLNVFCDLWESYFLFIWYVLYYFIFLIFFFWVVFLWGIFGIFYVI